jgi:transcriptional regulator with XRE-family HTH domain
MTNVVSFARYALTIKPDSHRYYRVLGRQIAELRKSRGYTQAELARALGVSQQAVFAYELGDRRVPVIVLEQIASFFAVSVDQVMGRVPVRPTPKRRLSPRAMRHAERIQRLSRTAQRFIVRLIDHIEAMGWNVPKRKAP